MLGLQQAPHQLQHRRLILDDQHRRFQRIDAVNGRADDAGRDLVVQQDAVVTREVDVHGRAGARRAVDRHGTACLADNPVSRR